MTYALSGMQTPHTPYCVGLTLSPPAPLGFAYPEYTIFATSYTLSGMHFLSSPPPPPSGMHTMLSPAKICFKLYRVCIPHIFHVANDFIYPLPLRACIPRNPPLKDTLSLIGYTYPPQLHLGFDFIVPHPPSGIHTPHSPVKKYR